jgi:hypothetical protein
MNTTFTLFPELPFELRLKCWSFVAPGPRRVHIKYQTKYNTTNARAVVAFSGWTSPDPAPVILHICHESREEALKSYQLSFGSVFSEARVYFNFSIDTLCFGATPESPTIIDTRWSPPGASGYLLDVILGGSYGTDDIEKLRYLSIDIPEDLYARKSFCWDEIRMFPVLEKLTIISWDEKEMSGMLMDQFRRTLTTVSNAHPQWVIPKITAISAQSWEEWGVVQKATT